MADLPRLEDLPLERGQRVLVRVDLNVPLREDAIGTMTVEDDLRIATALPTLEWLRERGAVIVVAGHLGRPQGEPDPKYSMRPVATRLGELLGEEVVLAPAVVGPRVEPIVASAAPGDVVLLENLRFEQGETANDPPFAANLAALADLYVNEAFGASHRSHASIVGPPLVLPHAGGRLLFREVEVLSRLLEGAARPFVAVLGGAKVGDKLGVIDALLDRCDTVLVGGAMAFTFLVAQGHSVGDSLVQPEMVDECRRLLDTGRVRIPVDVVVAREPTDDAETRVVAADAMPDGWKGLDVGPETRQCLRGRDSLRNRALERPHGHVRSRPLPPELAGSRKRSPRRPRSPWSAGRQRRRHPRVRSCRSGRPCEHRWRCLARVHRAR